MAGGARLQDAEQLLGGAARRVQARDQQRSQLALGKTLEGHGGARLQDAKQLLGGAARRVQARGQQRG
jgi:hypothetical protein